MTLPLKDGFSDWPIRCSQFNHGWLRNRFCQSLKAANQVMAGRVFRERGIGAHPNWIQEWLEHEETARLLIADFVEEMSPAALFSCPPLSHLDPIDAAYFWDIAQCHWLKRHHIEARIKAAEDALALAGDYVRRLRDSGASRDLEGAGLLTSLHDTCMRLADSLSQLPKAIVL